jgi:hypothetical protein
MMFRQSIVNLEPHVVCTPCAEMEIQACYEKASSPTGTVPTRPDISNPPIQGASWIND